MNTAGPHITLSHSTLFCYSIHEAQKNLFPAGNTVCVESASSPHVCMGWLQELQLPPTSQSCAHEVNWCLQCPSEYQCVMSPAMKGHSVQG